VSGGASPDDAFDAAHRALALFAHAIAGRPLRLVRCGLPVASARLARAGDDSGTVRIGTARGDDAARAWRIAVLREVLRGEGATAVRDRPRAVRPAHAVLRARIMATLERVRVDAVLSTRWPGATGDLARTTAAALARCAPVALRHPVRALLAALEHASLGDPGDVADDPLGLRARVLGELGPLRVAGASAADAAAAADRIVAAIVEALDARRRGATLRVLAPDGPAPDDAGGAGGRRDGDAGDARPAGEDGDGAPVAVSGGDASARIGRGEAPQVVGAAEPPGRDERPRDDAPRPRRAAATRAPVKPPPGGVLHDEWDYLSGRWLRGWCRVHERRLRGTDTAFVDDVRRRHPELARSIRERFARMRPTGRTAARRVGDGDELDLDGLVEAVVDRRAGRASDERAYVRRDPAVRDVAAAFLVDMSASTAVALPDPDPPARAEAASRAASWVDSGALLYGAYDDDPEPEPRSRAPRRRVVDVEKDALALMADALATLGDACAVYGFSGNGRDDVEFHVAKDFADPPSRSSWAALAAIEPRGSTRMGAAIRHAAAKLARQPASLRLLVVVSDGYPQDTDYGPDRLDEEYGIQDTARALRDVEATGTRTFCVTVDPAGHDYLRRMCPPRRYLVIDDVPALPAELARVYATLAGRG
jgi:nitric oxide reductase NorD protein